MTAAVASTSTVASLAGTTPGLCTRRGVVATFAAMVVLALLYANFMVPLLQAGLADAPMVTVADPTQLNSDFVAVGDHLLPPGFEWIGFLLVLATLSLGPLVAGAGMVIGAWVTVAELRARRLLRAIVSTLTCLGFAAVLVLALSPWGHTAKAWFFD